MRRLVKWSAAWTFLAMLAWTTSPTTCWPAFLDVGSTLRPVRHGLLPKRARRRSASL